MSYASMFFPLSLLLCLLHRVSSFERFVPSIRRFVPAFPVYNGVPCQELGHRECIGGGKSNQFGQDFVANGAVWSRAFCALDSDNDGKTNGDELGDPCCTLVKNGPLQRSDSSTLSLPGDALSATPYASCSLQPPAAVPGGDFVVATKHGASKLQLSLSFPSPLDSCFCSFKLDVKVHTPGGDRTFAYLAAADRSASSVTLPPCGEEALDLKGATGVTVTPAYINAHSPEGVSGAPLTLPLDAAARDPSVDLAACSASLPVDSAANGEGSADDAEGAAGGAGGVELVSREVEEEGEFVDTEVLPPHSGAGWRGGVAGVCVAVLFAAAL